MIGPFNLIEGVARVIASHSGDGNFIVSIIGVDGGEDLSINEIGMYSGTRSHAVHSSNIFGLLPGQHRIEVTADGNWTIDVEQDFPVSAQSLPLKVSGRADGVVSWVRLEGGQYIMRASHTSGSNFIVELIEADGNPSIFSINEIGSYTGEQLLRVDPDSFGLDPVPGIYAIVVQDDGDWEVSIEN